MPITLEHYRVLRGYRVRIVDMTPDSKKFGVPIYRVECTYFNEADDYLPNHRKAYYEVECRTYWYVHKYLVPIIKTRMWLVHVYYKFLRFINLIGLANTPINQRMSWKDIRLTIPRRKRYR